MARNARKSTSTFPVPAPPTRPAEYTSSVRAPRPRPPTLERHIPTHRSTERPLGAPASLEIKEKAIRCITRVPRAIPFPSPRCRCLNTNSHSLAVHRSCSRRCYRLVVAAAQEGGGGRRRCIARRSCEVFVGLRERGLGARA